MGISKIELLENELEISSARLELLEIEDDRIFQEHQEIHCKLSKKMREIRQLINHEEKIIKKINNKIIKLKKINNNIV